MNIVVTNAALDLDLLSLSDQTSPSPPRPSTDPFSNATTSSSQSSQQNFDPFSNSSNPAPSNNDIY